MLEKSNLEVIESNQISQFKKINKPLSLMRLAQGAFGGLEILFNNQGIYDHSLRAIGNYNVIMQIDLNNFKEFKTEIKEFLHNFYIDQKEILKALIKKKLSIKNFKNSIFENTKFKKLTTEQKIQKFYNEMKNTGLKPKTELLRHNAQLQKKYVNKSNCERVFNRCDEDVPRDSNRILPYNSNLIKSNINLFAAGV